MESRGPTVQQQSENATNGHANYASMYQLMLILGASIGLPQSTEASDYSKEKATTKAPKLTVPTVTRKIKGGSKVDKKRRIYH